MAAADETGRLANWNGSFMKLEDVKVSVLDRSFLFGDAIYEVCRVYQGKIFLFDEHMDRLARSLSLLEIKADVARVAARMKETVARSGLADGTVYVQITRGEAPRTHYFPESSVPNELIYTNPMLSDPYASVRSTGCNVITQADERWQRCTVKSVNLLANCLAMTAAKRAGATEAILIDSAGMITEGSHTSVFAVKNGVLFSPPESANILPGCTRRFVLKLAFELGIPHTEHSVSINDRE